MLGLWLEAGELRVRDDLPAPEPSDGEALVRVQAAGICNTDLELVRGYLDFTGVPGHEFVGVVESGPREIVGRRVVGEINLACGECPTCRRGDRSHCPQRTVLGIRGKDGAFAEFLTLPVGNLHVVPEGLRLDWALFTEPLAAALEIAEQVPVRPGSRVVVVGDGKLGQLIARALRLTGCELTVIGRHVSKLQVMADEGIATAFAQAVPSGVFNVAVECTGNADGFELARACLRPRGTLVMKSTYAGQLPIDPSVLVVDELTVVGSRCGPFAPALRLLAEGRVAVEPLIQARYPLSEGLAAFEHARRPGALKVLLEID